MNIVLYLAVLWILGALSSEHFCFFFSCVFYGFREGTPGMVLRAYSYIWFQTSVLMGLEQLRCGYIEPKSAVSKQGTQLTQFTFSLNFLWTPRIPSLRWAKPIFLVMDTSVLIGLFMGIELLLFLREWERAHDFFIPWHSSFFLYSHDFYNQRSLIHHFYNFLLLGTCIFVKNNFITIKE